MAGPFKISEHFLSSSLLIQESPTNKHFSQKLILLCEIDHFVPSEIVPQLVRFGDFAPMCNEEEKWKSHDQTSPRCFENVSNVQTKQTGRGGGAGGGGYHRHEFFRIIFFERVCQVV